MKIKYQLYLSSSISIILGVIFVCMTLITSREITEKNEKHALAHDLHLAISELDLITYEYLLHREERMEAQWKSRYNSAAKILRKADKEETGSIRANYITYGQLFFQVTRNYLKTKNLIQIGASQENIDAAVALEERLLGQLLITSQTIITDTFRLTEKSRALAMKIQKLYNALTLILVIIFAIFIVIISLLMARSIKKPLDGLIKGTNIIGTGNLKYRIDIKGKDEFGLLATAFNQMIENLKKVTELRNVEHKQAEEERKKFEVQLRQQQKLESIGTLASGVAHEINNPINGIINYAQLIGDKLDKESSVRDYAEEIIHESERVATIVRNLLAFSRDEKESHSPANIKDIVDGTISLVQTIIRHDQIALKVGVAEELPKIKCRSQQIQQVLMNLLTNSRDALNERYPEYDENKILTITVRPFEKEGKKWIRTTVEDHGRGIPLEIQDRLFDPFFSTKDKTKGTGLGLSISYGIVQEHNGLLYFESAPEQCTRFFLELPVDNHWALEGQGDDN